MSAVGDVIGILKKRADEIDVALPPMPNDFDVSVDASDDDSDAGRGKPSVEFIGCVFGLLYYDSRGRESRRRVTIRSLEDQGHDILVRAYCHERRAPRAFKASRIGALVDLQTGETDNDAAAFFGRYLSDDPTYSALRECGPAMQVLTFMAQCDGVFYLEEQGVIIDYVQSTRPESELHVPAVQRHVAALYPDDESFFRGLSVFMNRGEDEFRQLMTWIRRVIEADGEVQPEEVSWLIEAEEVLGARFD